MQGYLPSGGFQSGGAAEGCLLEGREYYPGDVLRMREQDAGGRQLLPPSATCAVTAAQASADELLAARKAVLKLLRNCVIVSSSALCFSVVFLNYSLSGRWPSSSPMRPEFCYQKCLFSDSLPSSPSSRPLPHMQDSAHIVTVQLYESQHTQASGTQSQGTGHYNTPEALSGPFPSPPSPGRVTTVLTSDSCCLFLYVF